MCFRRRPHIRRRGGGSHIECNLFGIRIWMSYIIYPFYVKQNTFRSCERAEPHHISHSSPHKTTTNLGSTVDVGGVYSRIPSCSPTLFEVGRNESKAMTSMKLVKEKPSRCHKFCMPTKLEIATKQPAPRTDHEVVNQTRHDCCSLIHDYDGIGSFIF
jgi:hypothetical protein